MKNKEHILQEFGLKLPIDQDPDIVLDPYSFGGFSVNKSQCRIEIWKLPGKAMVLFIELISNKGVSVTDAAERLVTEIYNSYLPEYSKDKCLFAETYDKEKGIDIVIPVEWNGNQCVSVEWFYYGK